MFDINNIMQLQEKFGKTLDDIKNAAKDQKEKLDAKMNNMTFESQVGAGIIKININGFADIKSLSIDYTFLQTMIGDDKISEKTVKLLENMFLTVFNSANAKRKEECDSTTNNTVDDLLSSGLSSMLNKNQ